MAFSAYQNISSNTTQELLDAGENSSIKSISIANTHDTHGTHVNLFINDSTNTYYFLKNYYLERGDYIILSNQHLNFDNRIQGYGLFLKLTGIAGSTGSVDVMIKR